jgi:ABC-type multidrug transport system fused ATPase/permease subunit
MKVWQPGSHLMAERGADVGDWSWRRTARRIATLARLAAPYKLRTLLALASLLAATVTALAPPYLAKLAIDEGIRKADFARLSVIVALFLVAGAATLATSSAQTYFTGWTGERILADLRTTLFRHLQRLSLGFYERNRAGVIISRLTNDVEALDQLVTDGVTTLVQNTLVLFGSAAILFFLDWRLALATLGVLPLMAGATALFRVRSARAYRAVRERLGLVTATLAEDIAGMRVVQAFTREQKNLGRFRKVNEHYRAVRERLGLVTATLAEDIAGMRVVQAFTREQKNLGRFRKVNEHYRAANHMTVVTNGLYFPFVDFLSSAATAVVLGYGGYRYFDGAVSIGTLLAFMLYLSNFFDPVQQLSQLYNTFLSAVAALDKIMDVLDEQPQVVDRPDARELPQIAGHVRFEDVRFTYGTGPEVLHGIDLDVEAGTTVALVGHTGAGKSTIAKLLARFYDPTDGRLTIDGIDLRDVTQASLRRQLGIVPQEGFLFAGTVTENIAFGNPDAAPDEVVRAAQTVGAHEFVLRLEDGYETHLGERGSRLSLGQRQLVAFARALLADPRVLILDEATSSVDIGTERKIEEALRVLLRDRTAFIIAHRLSTIRDADLIVVLEHGQIVEQGTHDELLARAGLYLSLYGDWAADVA